MDIYIYRCFLVYIYMYIYVYIHVQWLRKVSIDILYLVYLTISKSMFAISGMKIMKIVSFPTYVSISINLCFFSSRFFVSEATGALAQASDSSRAVSCIPQWKCLGNPQYVDKIEGKTA